MLSASSSWLEFLQGLLRRIIGGAVDIDLPLMDAGLDSLNSVEIRSLLQDEAGGSMEVATLQYEEFSTLTILTILAKAGGW